MLRRFSALLALAGLLVSPAAGFDSYWHSQCTQKVGERFDFAEDAWKIMQMGNFSPDFFGPTTKIPAKECSSNRGKATAPRKSCSMRAASECAWPSSRSASSCTSGRR